MEKSDIAFRVKSLRQWMDKHGLKAFIIPSTDPHNSEYVSEHWASRQWISGFNGSAGTAVVTMNEAVLWTDSRYFLAADEQLADTPFSLMKEGLPDAPTVAQWLTSKLRKGDKVGIDGWVFDGREAEEFKTILAAKEISLDDSSDPMVELWKERPAIPENVVMTQPLKYAGETIVSKLERLRGILKQTGRDGILVSALDEVAWMFNLRGTDVYCNPVFVAYCLMAGNETTLYVNPEKLQQRVRLFLNEQGIFIMPYEKIVEDLKQLSHMNLLLPAGTNARLAQAAGRYDTLNVISPVATLKAVKNAAEIKGFHQAMLRDGVAMVKFLRWLKPAVRRGGLTEMGVDRKLTALRAESPMFRDISFDTIAAYQDHGAIVHYEATPETDCELKPKGFLLLDSGAQYVDGTTDITRTIALGRPTSEEKHIYTLVLKGHIGLSRLKFPEGSSGTQLDLAARYAMWQEGYNYGHGTGHGVGSYLNVHEGPHQIRMNWKPAPIVAGMTVTDEPGIYLPKRFGVRIENMLLAKSFRQTDFGHFLCFEPLTLCPIDTTPIERSLLSKEEIEWINKYHQTVRQKLLPLLENEADRRWLIENTQEIE